MDPIRSWIESRAEPESTPGGALWRGELGEARWALLGRGAPPRDDPEASRRLGLDLAWLRQIHSERVLEVDRPGCAGEGDGLLTARVGLAATVAAADCVPVLLAGAGRVAAVHAGWRGLACGVVPAGVRRFDVRAAWIGPAIGPCCYEVGEDVAAAVVTASSEAVRRSVPNEKPRLDLQLAAAWQLAAAGVGEIHALRHCTRCRAEWLESHRRDGVAAGRNLAAIWLASA
ncbi:MAG: laccase domain-containing protein [Holophagales bacterium]|nr:laccase domain-containing protein [Holophagales bacterium]